MFKNAIVYRLGGIDLAALSALEIVAKLDEHAFMPCGPTQPVSSGWVPPRGFDHGPLVESVGGQLVLKLMTEVKVLPADAVKRTVEVACKLVLENTGRKPGKTQRKMIKEEVYLTLLPKALTRRSSVLVLIDPKSRLLAIDTNSVPKSDVVVSYLGIAVDGLTFGELNGNTSTVVAMADWLNDGSAPAPFTVDRECELKSSDEMRSVVRYGRHSLDIDEIRAHIANGKVPTKLAVTWNSRVSFVLTDLGMRLLKLSFLEGVFVGRSLDADAFDADVTIMSGELGLLVRDLLDVLGGEYVPPVPETADDVS